uniref:Lipoprotein n=1 Tax=Geobacter metallireducens TaxID=28232 RepID=A0A831XDV7_GEOME
MSRFMTKLLALCWVLVSVAGCGPFRAAEQPPAGPASSAGKNLCLLESEGCPPRKMSIIELIRGLREEVAKGEAVYTPAELRRLETRLWEYELMYDRLMHGNND